ncbi:MAG: hypothetical protein ACI4Q3_04920, partial [Kiritimatiellia bacterium]
MEIRHPEIDLDRLNEINRTFGLAGERADEPRKYAPAARWPPRTTASGRTARRHSAAATTSQIQTNFPPLSRIFAKGMEAAMDEVAVGVSLELGV